MRSEDDELVRALGEAWQRRYDVPVGQALSNFPGARTNFVLLHEGCLSASDLKTKILVCAHGYDDNVALMGPAGLIAKMQSYGLKEAGLIAFKSCRAGKGTFLDDFVAALPGNMRIGWVSGYLANTIMMKGRHGVAMATSETDMLLHEVFGTKLSDSRRIKVVRGNQPNVLPPNGPSNRYA